MHNRLQQLLLQQRCTVTSNSVAADAVAAAAVAVDVVAVSAVTVGAGGWCSSGSRYRSGGSPRTIAGNITILQICRHQQKSPAIAGISTNPLPTCCPFVISSTNTPSLPAPETNTPPLAAAKTPRHHHLQRETVVVSVGLDPS